MGLRLIWLILFWTQSNQNLHNLIPYIPNEFRYPNRIEKWWAGEGGDEGKGTGEDIQVSVPGAVHSADLVRAGIFEIQGLLSVKELLCVFGGFVHVVHLRVLCRLRNYRLT